jgi:hypothetical protein
MWKNESSSHDQLGHQLAFTKSDEEPNGTKLSSNTPLINKLRASHGDRVAVSRIGSALNGAA